MLQGCGEKRNPLTLLVGMYTSTTTTESRMGDSSKNSKQELHLNTAIRFLGIFPEELTSSYYSDTCIPMFRTAQFVTAKLWKWPICPSTDKWIKSIWYTKCNHFDRKQEDRLCGDSKGIWVWGQTREWVREGEEKGSKRDMNIFIMYSKHMPIKLLIKK